MAKFKPVVSFSGTFGSYAPGDVIDENALTAEAKTAGVIADWLNAGFIVPVAPAIETAAAPVVTETATPPAVETAEARPVTENAAKPRAGKKGKK